MPLALLPWIGSAVGGWAIFDWFSDKDEQTISENPLQTLNLTKLALGALGLFLGYKLIASVIK